MKKWAAAVLCLLFLLLSPARELRLASQTGELALDRAIALTFDDGPRASTTSRLLDGLAQRGVHATFFLIGEQIPGNEAIVQRLAQEGHQIGVHTYDHIRLEGESAETVRQQMARTDRLLTDLLGPGEWWLRPPYGQFTRREAAWIDVPAIQWTIDPEDWRYKDAERVARHILQQAEPGAVILLHDIYPTSVDAALAVVDALQEQGYTFMTVEELFQAAEIEPVPGVLYRSPAKPMWEL